MSRATRIALLACAALLVAAAPAQAAFGLNEFDVFFSREDGSAATQAGSHPFEAKISFGINYTGVDLEAQPEGEIKDATVTLPTGLVLNPVATPRCSTADFLAQGGSLCPAETQVGESVTELDAPGTFSVEPDPIYNLVPPPGSAARLGFRAEKAVPVVIDGTIEENPPFNLIGRLRNAPQAVKVFGSEITFFGTPSAGGTPLITLPTSCSGPLLAGYEALSWEGETDAGSVLSHDAAGNPQGFLGCSKPPFGPTISAQPTTEDAESSSGLDFELGFDQAGLLSSKPDALAQSTVKEAVVTLPEGMTVNPSLAEGLGVCTTADLGRETLAAAPGQGCPNASKIGSIQIDTPLLEDPLPGAAYIAQQDDPATSQPGAENPFDSLIALYFVIKDPARGVLVKLPAKVEPDPVTGQLVTTVKDAPQLPFTSFSFHFREGQRAPLITPPSCDSDPSTPALDPYTIQADFTPWARPDETVEATAPFQIASGPGGGPCPGAGVPPFEPGFEAGAENNAAGAHSPFVMRLTRRDGDQDLTKLSALLPPGVTGRLAGVSKCADALIALARAKSGRAEQASPSCPASSAIGHTLGGAGVGAALTYVPGSLYLTGPYHGAPLSVAAITPAVAGPFDAGTVVVRVALRVDPITARVSVDGAASDPIPHILKGIPLKVRELRVATDRPEFTLNPTSCDPSQATATLWGSFLDLLSPADDVPVGRFARYQAAGCAALGFAPRLDLRLRGGTRRGAFPQLRTVYRPRAGDANLEDLALRLPRSEFVEQGHFRTICTRVQFAADACPAASVYGHVSAFTPLLDEPLEGPVYLRSSSHNLPDLVLELHGLIDIETAVRIDSVRGGLRASLKGAPDAPITKVVVEMQGGQKGLIVNSRNLCLAENRANAVLDGQNGKRETLNPLLRAGCQSSRKARRASHRRARARASQ